MAAESVWVIDDDQSIRWVLEKALEKAKMDVKSFSSASGILETLERALDSTWESLDLNQRVNYIKARAADLIEHLIQLSVVFILQTGILPIAFLWVFLQLFKQLFRENV